MTLRLATHNDLRELNQTMAAEIAAKLEEALKTRGEATLVVSGGRTPAGLFDALSWHNLDWSHVTVTLADERWVNPGDDDSNERLVRRYLLQNQAAQARFVPLKNPAATPEAGAAECNSALARLPRPFDMVVLGMGDDGHTASLFPDAREIVSALESKELCAAVRPTNARHARMSMTPRAILDARTIAVQISGSGKRQIMARALQAGPVAELPIRVAIAQQSVPVAIHWCP